MDKILERRRVYYEGTYGVGFDYLMGMLEANGGGCAICDKEISFTSPKVTARVDHCHSTGEVRGILCNRCNQLLGMFGDNAEGVTKFLKYLEG